MSDHSEPSATSDRFPPVGQDGAGPGPSPRRTWVQRTEGDRRARSRLKTIEGEGVVVLNDRRIPGPHGTAAMVAVSSAGVFVVDAKHYKGLVHTRRSGPVAALGPEELHVGRRDCTPHVHEVAHKMGAVQALLGAEAQEDRVPVHAMFLLTGAAWAFASPIQISGVWIGWPRIAAERVRSPGTLDPMAVQDVSSLLSRHLPTS